MGKPKQIKCTNEECFEGTIEIENGAETDVGICPVCKGTGFIDVEILLSVCMIVGKEEDNLKRCLDSILPLTFQSWCELIIICTQKGDRTEEIARQYADYVEFQQWENDFSKHRNYGIALAKGKRILIIDADEELRQDSLYLLQDMVLNPEYSEFGTMFINVNNIISKNKKLISVVQQPRIFVNPHGKPLYEGIVHNRATATDPYFLAKNIFINHYGYMFEDNLNLKKEKFERSMPLLLKEYEVDKTNMRALTHIVKTYHTEGMHKEVMKYGKEWIAGMRKAKKNGEYNDGWAALLEIFNILVASCIVQGEIKKALKFKKISEEFSERLPMVNLHIGYYYAIKDNEIEAVKYLERGVQITNQHGGVMEGLTASHVDMIIDEIFVWLAAYYFRNKDYDKAGKYLNAGVAASKRHADIRWDIFNEERCKRNLLTE